MMVSSIRELSEAAILISYLPFFSVSSKISWILSTNSRLSSGKYWLPWEFKSFVAFLTEIPWLEVMYSPPSRSSLKAKNDASQIGMVFLPSGRRVLMPCAAWILAIASRYKSELYLTSRPAIFRIFLSEYFSFATRAFAKVARTIPTRLIGNLVSCGYKMFWGPRIPAVETFASLA